MSYLRALILCRHAWRAPRSRAGCRRGCRGVLSSLAALSRRRRRTSRAVVAKHPAARWSAPRRERASMTDRPLVSCTLQAAGRGATLTVALRVSCTYSRTQKTISTPMVPEGANPYYATALAVAHAPSTAPDPAAAAWAEVEAGQHASAATSAARRTPRPPPLTVSHSRDKRHPNRLHGAHLNTCEVCDRNNPKTLN